MQRKKTPLLRLSPLVRQSSCSTKSDHSPVVCKSPGPFVMLSHGLFVTMNCELARLGSASNFFQPERSLPLKRGFISIGRSLTLRSESLVLLGTSKEIGSALGRVLSS